MSQVFLLFFAVLISLSSVSLAQTNRSYLGFQAGPNLASLRGGDYLKDFFNPRIGFAGGFTYRTDISKVVALATGVIIERKGRKADGEITNATRDPLGDIKGHEHHDYLTVPLLARLNFGNKKKFLLMPGLTLDI